MFGEVDWTSIEFVAGVRDGLVALVTMLGRAYDNDASDATQSPRLEAHAAKHALLQTLAHCDPLFSRVDGGEAGSSMSGAELFFSVKTAANEPLARAARVLHTRVVEQGLLPCFTYAPTVPQWLDAHNAVVTAETAADDDLSWQRMSGVVVTLQELWDACCVGITQAQHVPYVSPIHLHL